MKTEIITSPSSLVAVATPPARHRVRAVLAAFGLASVTLVAWAEPYAVVTAERHILPRSTNGRDYALYVGLPASYAISPTRRYPVVYVTDGYWGFSPLMSIYWNLTGDRAMPECVVVGIAYGGDAPNVEALRQLDLTPGTDPSTDPTGTTSGQAQAFLGVIADQIIPFIDATYRTDTSFRVLTGCSYGGLFVVYTMFERPGLFQGLIAASPALWWRNSYMLGREQEFAGTHTALPPRLYLTWGGDEYSTIQLSTRAMYTQLKASHYTGFTVAARELTGERHIATMAESYTRGLRFVFAKLAPVAPPADPGFSARPSFVNLSTRGRVGGGENVLIGGLVIQGTEPKRVLIRAAGPALTSFGVAHPVPNPRITVMAADGTTVVATNDDWSAGPDTYDISIATRRVSAFLFPAGSLDAALLLTLEPGLYTAIAESVTGAEGIALLEAYEVP